jgi:hypothetical protein
MEDISSRTSKVIRGNLCDMREQNLRPTDKQRHRTSTVSGKKKNISR